MFVFFDVGYKKKIEGGIILFAKKKSTYFKTHKIDIC